MKNKSNISNSILDYASFKIVYLIIFISFLYQFIYADIDLTYFEQFLAFRTDSVNLFLIFLSYSLCVFIVYKEIRSDIFRIIRLKNKGKYIRNLIAKEIKISSIIFLINLLMTVIVVNLRCWSNLSITNIGYYNMNIIVYILFNIFKHYIILILFVVFISLLNITFSCFIGGITSILLSLMFFFNISYENNILQYRLDYLNFTNLLRTINYNGNFSFELIHFALYVIGLILIFSILMNYNLKITKKGILE